jgi:tetratricopeptide (TPR) repeat protein
MERRIYLKQEKIYVGCGSTAKESFIDNFYEVKDVDQDHVKVMLLDMDDKPMGEAEVLPREKLKEFISCPDYFKSKKSSKELTVEKHVQCGDRHYDRKEFLSADHEYSQALVIDDNHLKANLGKGKALFARGDKEGARKIFSKLSQMDSLFDVENKHVFNEFGIELRKKGLFDEAISNYQKAVSLDPNDEILYYNLGRAYYEQGDRENAISQLKLALKIKEGFVPAEDFLKRIDLQ